MSVRCKRRFAEAAASVVVPPVNRSLSVSYRAVSFLPSSPSRSTIVRLYHSRSISPAHNHQRRVAPPHPPNAATQPSLSTRSTSTSIPHSAVFRLPRRCLFGLSLSSTSPPIKQQIRRRLPFPPSAFYSVVLDVPSYHLFLPYCLQSDLLTSTPATHSFSAQLTLGFSQFNERYTSLVDYSDPSTAPTSQLYRVHARSLNCTLFRHLSSTWEMRAVDGRPGECDVLFDIEMSISSPLHRALVSRVFSNVAEQQLTAFVQRAQQLINSNASTSHTQQRAAAPVNRGVI